MSLEDLERMGLLRDEDEPGLPPVRVSRAGMMLAVIVSLAACALMVYGDGGWMTGLGIAVFLVGLLSLVACNLRGVVPPETRPGPQGSATPTFRDPAP